MPLYRGDGGVPTSFGTSGRPCSTDSRAGLQMPWPKRPSAPPYNATDDSTVRPRGRFTCPRQLTAPWPTRCPRRLINVAADSPVRTGLPRRGRFTRERLQLHLAIVNFMADYFRPGTSGDIHLKYILLVHIIFYQRAVYLCLGLQYC